VCERGHGWVQQSVGRGTDHADVGGPGRPAARRYHYLESRTTSAGCARRCAPPRGSLRRRPTRRPSSGSPSLRPRCWPATSCSTRGCARTSRPRSTRAAARGCDPRATPRTSSTRTAGPRGAEPPSRRYVDPPDRRVRRPGGNGDHDRRADGGVQRVGGRSGRGRGRGRRPGRRQRVADRRSPPGATGRATRGPAARRGASPSLLGCVRPDSAERCASGATAASREQR
jgi:hypothetical protein